MIRSSLLAALGTAVLAATLPAQRQSGDVPFQWRGTIPAGGLLRLSSMKGEIRVERASGAEVEVRGQIAERRDGRDRRAPSYEVIQIAEGIMICVLVGDGECDDRGSRNSGWSDRDYDGADLTVYLPAGVRLQAGSGNGDVTVENAGADVRVSTGNGDVRVNGAAGEVQASSGNGAVLLDGVRGGVRASTGNGRVSVSASQGPTRVSSGNGPVEIRLASVQGAEDIQASTGNGRVTIHLPADFAGSLDISTGRGDAYTDFPIQLEGTLRRGRLRGTVAGGQGPTVRVSSGNGRVEIRRL